MKCSKAIILAGGFGTRWLPLAKAVDKCMIPIGNKPLVDVIVDDLIEAGITEIMFMVGENAQQIKTYYGHNEELEEHLRAKGKQKDLEQLDHLATKAKYHYSPRRDNIYGTAAAIWQCRHFVEEENEHILIVSGDQLLFSPDGSSTTAKFLQSAQNAGTPSAMMAATVPKNEVSKYGIVECHEENGIQVFDRIIEKPAVEDVPSNLINATFFLFDKKMFDYANPANLQSQNGEYYIVDSMNNYTSDGNKIAVIQTKAEYLDCGTVEGWLHANNRILGAK